MKLLLAIEATKPKELEKALRWCGRLGYDLRVFVAKGKRKKFLDIFDDCNYHWYLDIRHDQLISRTDAHTYARQHSYDLMLTVPENLEQWRKRSFLKPDELKHPVVAIGTARIEFGKKPRMQVKRFANGAIMRRVSNV